MHGDEWPIREFGGVSPKFCEAFSLEEAPTVGQGSSPGTESTKSEVFLNRGDCYMATIIPRGENIRKALKWISDNQLYDNTKPLSRLIQEAGLKFNLSPKEEAYLEDFYKENKD